MATYLVTIYLSFLVFLAIVFVLVTVFMPTIPAPTALGDSGFAGGSVGLSAARKNAYIQLLFHAAAIRGVASGLITGQMAKGTLQMEPHTPRSCSCSPTGAFSCSPEPAAAP